MENVMFAACPRCGNRALEVLRTHMHCIECGWSPDFEPSPGPMGINPKALEILDQDEPDEREQSLAETLIDTEDELSDKEADKEKVRKAVAV